MFLDGLFCNTMYLKQSDRVHVGCSSGEILSAEYDCVSEADFMARVVAGWVLAYL